MAGLFKQRSEDEHRRFARPYWLPTAIITLLKTCQPAILSAEAGSRLDVRWLSLRLWTPSQFGLGAFVAIWLLKVWWNCALAWRSRPPILISTIVLDRTCIIWPRSYYAYSSKISRNSTLTWRITSPALDSVIYIKSTCVNVTGTNTACRFKISRNSALARRIRPPALDSVIYLKSTSVVIPGADAFYATKSWRNSTFAIIIRPPASDKVEAYCALTNN